MDRWKSRGGKSQRRESDKEEVQGEKQRWEEKRKWEGRRSEGKAEVGREEKVRRKKIKEKKNQKKEDAGTRKGRKVAKHCVFPMLVAPEGRKVGSLKRRVRSHLGRWEMKNCTPLWREEDFEVKKLKTPHVRTTLRHWDVERCMHFTHGYISSHASSVIIYFALSIFNAVKPTATCQGSWLINASAGKTGNPSSLWRRDLDDFVITHWVYNTSVVYYDWVDV